jgi:hypothetical protein
MRQAESFCALRWQDDGFRLNDARWATAEGFGVTARRTSAEGQASQDGDLPPQVQARSPFDHLAECPVVPEADGRRHVRGCPFRTAAVHIPPDSVRATTTKRGGPTERERFPC